MEFDMDKIRNNFNPLLRRTQRQMSNKQKENKLSISPKKNTSMGTFDLLNEEPEETVLFEAPVQKTKLELYMGRNLGRGGRR